MFTIPVWDILSSYTWDSKKFSFSWEVFDGFFDDIIFRDPLEFDIEMIALEDWVEVLFKQFHTQISYDWKEHIIDIPHFERMWKMSIDPLEDGDDIGKIDSRSMTIDLAPVIREEIIMACHEL
jgi:hypothetical protein